MGAGLGGLVFLTLLTVKATFLIYVGAAIAIALTELAAAFAKRGINVPVIPVAAGGAAMMTCMYWLGARAALAALALDRGRHLRLAAARRAPPATSRT